MSKLKREAMGQYNYVAPTPIPEKGGRKRHSYPDFYPHTDVTVEIVDPNAPQLFGMKPPKMFDTSYFMDYRHPPVENFLPQTGKRSGDTKAYTAYIQTPKVPQKSKLCKPSQERGRPKRRSALNDRSEKQTKPMKPKTASASAALDEAKKADRSTIKSAGEVANRVRPSFHQPSNVAQRVKSADVNTRPTQADKVNDEFYRSLLKARTGPEWNRKPDVSYDIMNPEKPSLKRETKPYGAQMEEVQEQIAFTKGEKVRPQRPITTSSGAAKDAGASTPPSRPQSVALPPSVKRIGAGGQIESPSLGRASTASDRQSRRSSRLSISQDIPGRPMTSSSVSSIGGDYFLETGRHLNETLETIQEEEILDQLQPPSPVSPRPKLTVEKRKRKLKLKKPIPPADLFIKKGPDPRFYASKKNLRTPNEMERFRRARGRAYMRNVEQAIPELDFTDHEVKYQPERQLFQDARWRMRQDVKDVRDKNTHSLVDRFEKRHQIIKEETRTRLGDPTYIGRNPVSIYKLSENNREPGIGFKVKYPLHDRRRVTPSLGSVQRARNLGSHAQIFNQSIAPPYWGPQKVDHSLYLPAMAQGI